MELQGHGHTADVEDRPLSCEQMADDVAALLEHLAIEEADIFGFSMGGGVALQVAIRHPEAVLHASLRQPPQDEKIPPEEARALPGKLIG